MMNDLQSFYRWIKTADLSGCTLVFPLGCDAGAEFEAAEFLTELGATIFGVTFYEDNYHLWLNGWPDTRLHRIYWATHQVVAGVTPSYFDPERGWITMKPSRLPVLPDTSPDA